MDQAGGMLQLVHGAIAKLPVPFCSKPEESRMSTAVTGRRVVMPRHKFSQLHHSHSQFAAIIPGDSVVEQVFTTGLESFLSLYNTAILVRLVLTWFPNPPEFIAGPLSTLCDPYLNLFRGIIPPLGGTLDLSPILAFLTLSLFSNTAAALPCEVGPDGKPCMPKAKPSPWSWLQPSKYEQMWQRRMAAQQQRQE